MVLVDQVRSSVMCTPRNLVLLTLDCWHVYLFLLIHVVCIKGEGYWDQGMSQGIPIHIYMSSIIQTISLWLYYSKKYQQRHFQPVWVFIDAHLFIFVAILHKMQHKHFCVCSLFPVFCSCKEHLHMVSAVWEIFTLWFIPSYWTLLPFGVSSVRQHHTGWSNDRLYFHSSSSASLFLSHCSLCS